MVDLDGVNGSLSPLGSRFLENSEYPWPLFWSLCVLKIEEDRNENGLIDSTIEFLDNGSLYRYFDIDEDGINNYLFIDDDKNGDWEVIKKLS